MSPPPTETITFLFTDIEGSTRRWDHQPEAMKLALDRHNIILQSSIEAHGGHVFGTAGDSFCASFPDAVEALAAAVAAQRGLADERWGETGELRARMALHTGSVQVDNFFGPPLNRVARLMSAGHGGQILLSLATEELVRDQLPEGASLRDLGTHRLRDLIRPEQIFQVVAPTLPIDFPPLKTLEARPNNLQMQPTPLLGREREVEQLCAQLRREDVRLLTLTGPGGTGKTRLGLQVAADLLDDFKEGVFFVALAPLSDPTLVIATIAQTLGVQETGGRSILQCLQDYLREKSLLLALDNFEQITDAATQIARLLANAPRLKILVTSRIPLHLRGEHEVAVPPLALPDCKHLPALAALSEYASVELFIDRARAVKADFAVNNDNAPAVAEICVRLDGLPLAIELAAARIKLLSPQAMLVRLKDPLKFLTGGARELTARQQTLRGAIAWSHDLLDENEKRLFRRLGVFVGGGALDAVEAVCENGGDLDVDVFDGIASLVDKSLLRQQELAQGEPRFFMLETIREYALERLTESGEKEELQNRHAGFFLAFAERAENELHGFHQIEWLDRLEIEHDNLRAALNWFTRRDEAQLGLRMAGALAEFWSFRGHRTEAQRTFDYLLAPNGAAEATVARAKALDGAALNFSWESRMKLRSLRQESVKLWEGLGDQHGLLRAKIHLGYVLAVGDETTNGRALLEESVVKARERGDQRCLALALTEFGNISFFDGEINAAYVAEEEAIRLCRETGDQRQLFEALLVLADVMSFLGEPEKCRSLCEESLSLARQFRDDIGIGFCLTNLGRRAFNLGDHAEASRLFQQALEAARRVGVKRMIADDLLRLGEVARREGDESLAHSFYNDHIAVARASGLDDLLSGALRSRGWRACDNDDFAEARRCFDESLAIRRRLGDKREMAWAQKALGDLARMEGNSELASRVYAECLETARESDNRDELARMLGELGQAALDESDYASAQALFEEQITLYREVGAKARAARSQYHLGLVACYENQQERAARMFEDALAVFRALGHLPGCAQLMLYCATVKSAQDDLEQARAWLETSKALFHSTMVAERVRTDNLAGSLAKAYASQCLARVACAQGDLSAARAALKESMDIYLMRREDKRGIAEELAGFARLALAHGDAERAARLFGAAESLHKIVGPRLNPFDHHSHAGMVANLRSTLGDTAFTVAWAQGRAFATNQAISYALE